jgi:pimeloyl-ACP methyl ester carboxylesterase
MALGGVAEHRTVYVTSRKPGLAPGTTMADIAADYAAAIGEEFGGPVAFHGTPTGGAIGLPLAIGYPQLVRRLVLAAAACACHHRAATCWPRSPTWPRRVTRGGHRRW